MQEIWVAAINDFDAGQSYLKSLREVCCCIVECLGIDVVLAGLWACEKCYGSRFGVTFRVLSIVGK